MMGDWPHRRGDVTRTVSLDADGNYTINLYWRGYEVQETNSDPDEATRRVNEKLLTHLSEELGNDNLS